MEDDGIGIEETEQENAFRRFYRANPSRSEGGAGLGLSMAQEICRLHSGELTLQSWPGEGSCFTAVIPR